MGTASMRLLAPLLIAIAPCVSHAQRTVTGTPRVAVDSTARAKSAVLDSAALRKRASDSVALRRAIDSATKRAIDSATKRAIDSAFTSFAQERSDWHLAIWGLLVVGAVFLLLLVSDIVRGHDVLVESHWGGFGGGVGGTRFSRTLVLAVLLLLTGGMVTAVAISHPGMPRKSDDERMRDSVQKTPAAAPARALPSTAPTSAPPPRERAPSRIT